MSFPVPSRSADPSLADFEAVLRRHDSATVALEEWCALRGFPHPAQVTASTLSVESNESDEDVRRRLILRGNETVALRHVRLNCGPLVLSEAWNWYVPARLTEEMNAALRLGSVPFGKVVAPLGFRRRLLSAVSGPAKDCPPGTIATHRAMLLLPDERPLAYLVECYTGANLAPVR